MLYYWQTKYTTLIFRPFFIFPHNRHFFVHISPSVLGVWKFSFCKISFQPSEDTDALLSQLPPLSHNVVCAADPSQIRKDGSRRVPDQGYGRGVEELPTPSCNSLRCEASGVGASVVMQDDDVLSRTFIAKCATELVQYLDITSSSDSLPRFQEFGQNQPLCVPEDCAYHLRSWWPCFAFFFDGECIWRHSILCHFVSGSKWWNQLSSPVTIRSKKLSPSCRYLCSSSEVMAFRWLFGLRSISAGPNEHKLSYSLSFQSSPVLRCALIQVFGLLCPQSHACHLEWSHPLSPCCIQLRLFEGDRSEADLGCSCSHL